MITAHSICIIASPRPGFDAEPLIPRRLCSLLAYDGWPFTMVLGGALAYISVHGMRHSNSGSKRWRRHVHILPVE